MNQRPPRILLLDDDADIVEECAYSLKKEYLIVKTNSCFEAISFMDAGREMIDLVICDYNMPGMNGMEFVDHIRGLKIRTPIILITGALLDQADSFTGKFAKVLRKPFGVNDLREAVGAVLSQKNQESGSYRKFQGAIVPLRLSMGELQKYLARRGLADPSQSTPEEALRRFGLGDDFHVFMAWHYLQIFCEKVPEGDQDR